MKLFIDTANIEHIEEASKWGVIEGVTTNPSLIAKEGRSFKEAIDIITKLIPGPVSAEVTELESGKMITQARELDKWADNIAVKIPMTEEGIKATSVISKEGIKVNMTLIFSANQALLAAKAGAAYVSPFVGRLDDIGQDGMLVIEEIVQIFETFAIETEIISASIRHPRHVIDSAIAGADIATVPYSVLKQMFKHTLTDAGLKKFMSDWEKSGLT
ncbi:fructose-6-phosphate aldolase [bacterium]|nr:fructose-6-phosphate aldolase [bacterium]MBU1024847.1 fructose-6-phosphate aldolase [bacterium]